MVPETLERPGLCIAGVIKSGSVVEDIDIGRLWEVYHRSEPQIPFRIDGMWYELHVGSPAGNGLYTVMVGSKIERIGDLPIEVSMKRIPAGRYAHFAHSMKEGCYGDAFARIDTWVKQSGTRVRGFGLQLCGADFHPQHGILNIYIPLEE